MGTTKKQQAISLLAVVATVLCAAPVFAGVVSNVTVTDMSSAAVVVDLVNEISSEAQGSATSDIDLDGQFVDVGVTFLAEPAAMSLISLGGLLLFRKRPQNYVK